MLTFKTINGQHIVTYNNKVSVFADLGDALIFVFAVKGARK